MKRLIVLLFLATILFSLVSVSASADSLTLISEETGKSEYYDNLVRP